MVYLLNLCGSGAGGGTFVSDPGPADDDTILSPPTVLQMYLCADEVGISHARLGAEVELRVDGTPVATATVRNPDLTAFDITSIVSSLDPAQQWTARQRLGTGPWSDVSTVVHPVDHTTVYPAGLPAPFIVSPPVYKCSQAIDVAHVPGATIHVTRSVGSDFDARGTARDWSVIHSPAPFLDVGEELFVSQTLCTDTSPTSSCPVIVEPEPFPIGPPSLPALYDQQQLFLVRGLTHGTTQELTSNIDGLFASLDSFPVPVRLVDAATPLGRSLVLGETIRVDQTLCDSSSTGHSLGALSCDNLPPAEIVPPSGGDTEVALTGEDVPGSAIRIWSAGEEIGDSSGGRINLTRPLVTGETLAVMRELSSTCRAPSHFVIEVR